MNTQENRSSLVHPRLRAYVEQEILPGYDHFDAAHTRSHVLKVIEQSLFLSGFYDVDVNMVYAIAAYHDTGMVVGRNQHHIESARIIRGDARLSEWFSPAQIEVMACAAQDHRASSTEEPRSIYGKIVAEADRDIDPPLILERVLLFGRDHYPQLDKQGHYERFVAHLQEKYAEGGYLKLYLPESPNAERLEQLRAMIRDEQTLHKTFEMLWERFFAPESKPMKA